MVCLLRSRNGWGDGKNAVCDGIFAGSDGEITDSDGQFRFCDEIIDESEGIPHKKAPFQLEAAYYQRFSVI
ncbi:hypothetical protein D9X91_17555 [Falsibacillus albus]|uniref:Uncharacterized protein n=1 Tax=Falsibacillus albus TaxID=2478915 RepID=A0A3L7JTA1_9BACI|nr:hypothetical protein D9X91_17555 [Falsibacillus albus]